MGHGIIKKRALFDKQYQLVAGIKSQQQCQTSMGFGLGKKREQL
jgi:hypothetical protein